MRPVVGEMVMEWFLRKDLVWGEKRREVWMSRVEGGAGEGEEGSDAIASGVVAGGAIIARNLASSSRSAGSTLRIVRRG